MNKCINCEQEVAEKFCPHCGQKVAVKRISFKEGWFDFWARIYGFDGMFPRTMKDLTLRPGVTAKRFIAGNRVLYYGPVGYFFLMITFYLLAASLLSIDIYEYVKGSGNAALFQNSESRLADYMRRLVTDNLKVFGFLIIPCLTVSAKYIFFRKSPYNFLEHCILPFYMLGHLYWLSIALIILYKFTGMQFPLLVSGVAVFYTGYAYSTFIDYQSRVTSFFKGMGLYVVSYGLLFLCLTLMVMIAILLMPWISPDTYEIIRPSNNP